MSSAYVHQSPHLLCTVDSLCSSDVCSDRARAHKTPNPSSKASGTKSRHSLCPPIKPHLSLLRTPEYVPNLTINETTSSNYICLEPMNDVSCISSLIIVLAHAGRVQEQPYFVSPPVHELGSARQGKSARSLGTPSRGMNADRQEVSSRRRHKTVLAISVGWNHTKPAGNHAVARHRHAESALVESAIIIISNLSCMTRWLSPRLCSHSLSSSADIVIGFSTTRLGVAELVYGLTLHDCQASCTPPNWSSVSGQDKFQYMAESKADHVVVTSILYLCFECRQVFFAAKPSGVMLLWRNRTLCIEHK
jgi:hypothetical protein